MGVCQHENQTGVFFCVILSSTCSPLTRSAFGEDAIFLPVERILIWSSLRLYWGSYYYGRLINNTFLCRRCISLWAKVRKTRRLRWNTPHTQNHFPLAGKSATQTHLPTRSQGDQMCGRRRGNWQPCFYGIFFLRLSLSLESRTETVRRRR